MPPCAAAVLTYDRVEMASSTVRFLLDVERFADHDVFVVVNGQGGIDADLERRVTVVQLDQNLGPAGGMHAAMALVARLGYSWVYLCEDDVGALLAETSPRVCRILDEVRDRTPQPAAVLAYGRSMDSRTGLTRPLVPPSPTGDSDALVLCDVGAWGATMVNLTIVYPSLLPDERLWFGYEDFEFFLSLAEGGYPVLLDAITAAELGLRPHPSGRSTAYGDARWVDDAEPWRRYYEARNFVVVSRRHGRPRWLLWHAGKSLRRASLGGRAHWIAIGRGLYDGALGRLGRNPHYSRARRD